MVKLPIPEAETELAANVKVTDGVETVAVDTSNRLTVAANIVKPDGTNTMPSLDTVARKGFVAVTDGTETASVDTSNRIEVAAYKQIVAYTKVWKYVALANTNETTIWDPTAGTKFVVTDIHVSATAAGTCTVRDGTTGSTIWIASLAANGGFISNLNTPIQSSTADNILTAQASAATQYVLVCGYEV